MKIKWFIGFMGILLCFAQVPLIAKGKHPTHTKWWQNQRLVEQLQLDVDTVSKLEEQHYQSKMVLIDLRAEVKKARLKLDTLMEKEVLAESDLYDAFDNLEELRTKLAKERFRYLLEVRKLIGSENYMTLKKIVKRMEHGKKRPDKNRRENPPVSQ